MSYGVICHEYQSFGHMRFECLTYLKLKGKKVNEVSQTDDESEQKTDDSFKKKI